MKGINSKTYFDIYRFNLGKRQYKKSKKPIKIRIFLIQINLILFPTKYIRFVLKRTKRININNIFWKPTMFQKNNIESKMFFFRYLKCFLYIKWLRWDLSNKYPSLLYLNPRSNLAEAHDVWRNEMKIYNR